MGTKISVTYPIFPHMVTVLFILGHHLHPKHVFRNIDVSKNGVITIVRGCLEFSLYLARSKMQVNIRKPLPTFWVFSYELHFLHCSFFFFFFCMPIRWVCLLWIYLCRLLYPFLVSMRDLSLFTDFILIICFPCGLCLSTGISYSKEGILNLRL